MASIRIEALEDMFAGLRQFFAEEATRLEAESIVIMTDAYEVAGRERDNADEDSSAG